MFKDQGSSQASRRSNISQMMRFNTKTKWIVLLFVLFMFYVLSAILFRPILVTEPRPIKAINTISAYYLFGSIKIWTVDKSRTLFGRSGQRLSTTHYSDDDAVLLGYINTYNDFDSLDRVLNFGRNLFPYQMEVFTYDSLRRKTQSEIFNYFNTNSKYLSEKTIWLYDSLGRRVRTQIEHFGGEQYPGLHTVFEIINVFDSAGRVIMKKSLIDGGKENRTFFRYDQKGNLVLQVDGVLHDSSFFEYDQTGRLLVKREIRNGFGSRETRYSYDEKGNNIRQCLEAGRMVYEFEYDKYNRLVREYRLGTYYPIVNVLLTYSYEYY